MNPYTLSKYGREILEGKVAKLNKRAEKLGISPLSLEVVREWDDPVKDDRTGLVLYVRHMHEIVLHGEPPCLDGWRLLGTVEHTYSDVGNIIRAVPDADETILERYRKADSDCDHCKAKRRRNATHICRHEDGRVVQVGSTCVADFLGHSAPSVFEFFGDVGALQDFEEDFEGGDSEPGYRERFSVHVESFITWSTACYLAFGWVSSKAEQEGFNLVSTKSRAIDCMFPPKGLARADRDAQLALLTDAARKMAAEVNEWGKALKARPDLGTYLANLAVLFDMGLSDWKSLGILASAVVAYCREKDVEIDRRFKKRLDEHFGTEGKREVFTLTVERERITEGFYGTKYIYSFRDQDGRPAVWFASQPMTFQEVGQNPDIFIYTLGTGKDGQPIRYRFLTVEQGDTLTVKATVKKHDIYNEHPQTVLARCVVQSVVSTEEDEEK